MVGDSTLGAPACNQTKSHRVEIFSPNLTRINRAVSSAHILYTSTHIYPPLVTRTGVPIPSALQSECPISIYRSTVSTSVIASRTPAVMNTASASFSITSHNTHTRSSSGTHRERPLPPSPPLVTTHNTHTRSSSGTHRERLHHHISHSGSGTHRERFLSFTVINHHITQHIYALKQW